MGDPLPTLDAALDATGVRSAGLRSTIRALHPSAVAVEAPPLSVLVATFNAAGKKPPPGLDLSAWLSTATTPDLVAITFQEAVPLSAGNVVSGAVGAAGVEAWLAATDAALGGHYARASPPAQLVGLVLCVWVSARAAPLVRGAQATAVGGGGGGLRLGNKGVAAVRLLAGDAPVVFLAAHLPSGDGPGDASRRDACLADCLRRGAFPTAVSSSGNGAPAAAATPSDPWRGRTGLGAAVAGAAAAFLAGDLNYRLLAPDATVRKCLRAAKEAGGEDGRRACLEKLAALDELTPAALAGRGAAVLAAWTEAGPVSAFMPTFKLRPGGSGAYVGDGNGRDGTTEDGAAATEEDGAAPPPPPPPPPPGSGEPNPADGGATARTPAWTDRVLYRALPSWSAVGDDNSSATLVSPLSYTSAPAVSLSDHTPVAASFSFVPFLLDPPRLAAALESARRSADAAAMEAVPRCEAAPKALDLGPVRRGDACVRGGCVLSNTGRVTADWELAALPPDGAAHPPWLAVHPVSGTLRPGEAVAVEVRVAGGDAKAGVEVEVVEASGGPSSSSPPPLLGLHAAAAGAPSIDAVLVLRVEGGNDEFVLVSAEPVQDEDGKSGEGDAAAVTAAAVAAATAALTLADPAPPPRETEDKERDAVRGDDEDLC